MKIQMTVLTIVAAATLMAAPLGTEFTYQGVLSDAGAPASGIFDFQFYLYNAGGGGSQVGLLVVIEDVTVTDGRFTTQLDFGSVFDGTALWLEVGVRDGSSIGTFTVLSPRQELTAAPFAQHAQSANVAGTASHATTADSATTAGHATTAGDADTLDGQHGAYYLTWANFVGIPNDIANGDDDTLGDLSCSSDEIARWNGTAWSCTADDDTPYSRTYVVGPVGTPIENGLALDVAMGDIPTPTTQEGAVLVKVEPGVYDLGSQRVALGPWMIIEGAGQELTRITSEICSVGVYQVTIILGPTAGHAGLRDLTVENTCADAASYSIALSNQADWFSADHVTLSAEGAALNGYAMFNSGGSISLTDTTLRAENGTADNHGLHNRGVGASLTNVTVDAVGGASAHGIDNEGEAFTFRQGKISATFATTDCVGIFNHTGAENLRVLDSTIAAEFGTAPNQDGVHIHGAHATLRNVEVNAITGVSIMQYSDSSAFVYLYDVYTWAAETAVWARDFEGNGCGVRIDGGRLNAGSAAVVNSLDSCDVQIGGAFLGSGVSGAATCAGVYDGSYTFFASTCPPL